MLKQQDRYSYHATAKYFSHFSTSLMIFFDFDFLKIAI